MMLERRGRALALVLLALCGGCPTRPPPAAPERCRCGAFTDEPLPRRCLDCSRA
ncbi:MAG: hypothetical protein Q8Q14_06370 [Gemmatimonadales bacterium]|nr:hypothetical protein [Gemmatimonadales bacterium]